MTRTFTKAWPTLELENDLYRNGYHRVAGIDEAGRGPLAGPVVAAAVVLPSGMDLSGIDDSKALSNKARQNLYHYIVRAATTAVGIVEHTIIDEINILEASRLAMITAVEKLPLKPDYLLIDGPIRLDVAIDQRGIIGGDKLSVSVAAASIVAKVTRDSIMQKLHGKYPQYGFDRNKGYPTQNHRKAIAEFAPSPVHRKTFRGVKEFVE